MRKIISLFQRNYDGDRLVRDEVVPGAEWVVAGEGIATQKFDGECHMIREGSLYRRHDVKRGKKPPQGWEPAQEADPVTGHHPGWVRCDRANAEHRWSFEAFDAEGPAVFDGTYELCGPKVQGNPERCASHRLIRHGIIVLGSVPRDFAGLRRYFAEDNPDIEGIVWHHQDGRMVKIKLKDFGLKREAKK